VSEETASMLPIFLKLAGRPCLLVGAGHVALEKIGSLLKTGLRLTVVAPDALAEVRALAAAGRLQWVKRAFEPADLNGNYLVVTATDSPAVNQLVFEEAGKRGVLCNSVDDVPNCDFYFGSVVSRGPLQIAISTAGESPAVAQRLRREIDEQLPEDMGRWLTDLGELRREVLETHPRGEARKALLHQLAQRDVCGSDQCPSRQMALGPLDEGDAGEPFFAMDGDEGDSDEVPESQESLEPEPGRVFLVGAGPGDPDLLTVKAVRLIQTADVVLHDDLVPQQILDLASPCADIANVGKRCGVKNITQAEINALMVAHARAGRNVVRLKSGDPLIFGRAAEEIAALGEAGVGFEVVPGITAGFAAAAAIGCSLTSRNAASKVIFTTGHHALSHHQSRMPELEDATRVVYMPGRDLTLLAAEWMEQGLPAELPCAVVSRAAQPGQQVLHTTLGALGEAEAVAAPSLVIAGWTVREMALAETATAGEIFENA